MLEYGVNSGPDTFQAVLGSLNSEIQSIKY